MFIRYCRITTHLSSEVIYLQNIILKNYHTTICKSITIIFPHFFPTASLPSCHLVIEFFNINFYFLSFIAFILYSVKISFHIITFSHTLSLTTLIQINYCSSFHFCKLFKFFFIFKSSFLL